MTKLSDKDHHANQLNPNNPAHKSAMDNHANQLNPNNEAFKRKQQADFQEEYDAELLLYSDDY